MFETGGLAGRRCWCAAVVWDDEGYDEFGENDCGGLNRNFGGLRDGPRSVRALSVAVDGEDSGNGNVVVPMIREQELIIPLVSLPSFEAMLSTFYRATTSRKSILRCRIT